MTTESPIRMLDSEESKKWLPTIDSGSYSSPFSNVAGHEGVGSVLQQTIVRKEQTRMTPSRSGSAPPTVEGSIVGFQAFMDQQNSGLTSSSNELSDCEPEEQMRTDPAYIQYYYANVNLNPRLPPPLISRENRRLVQHMGSFVGKKIPVTEGFLATHKEEPEEAMSPREVSSDQESSVDDTKMASLAGHSGSSGDIKEGDFVQAPSSAPSTTVKGGDDQAPSSAPSTTVKGGDDHDIVTVSTTDQNIKMQESCSVSVDEHSTMSSSNPSVSSASYGRPVDLEDNVSNQSNIGSDVSAIESRMKSLDVSGELMREDDQKRCDYLRLLDESRLLPHPSQGSAYQLPGLQAYAAPRGMYAVQQKPLPLHQAFMHNTGLVPPLYASTAAHMNAGNLFYPSVPQPGFPSPQFSLSGLSVNSTLHPHFGSYLQGNAFPMPIDTYSKLGFFEDALPGGMNPYASQMLPPPLGGPVQGHILQQLYENARKNDAQCQMDALASQRNSVASVSSMVGRGLNHLSIDKPSISPLTSEAHLRFTSYGYHPSLGEPQFLVHPGLAGSSVPRHVQQQQGNDMSASQHSSESTAAYPGWKGEGRPESSDSNNNSNPKRPSFLELLKSCNSRMLELSEISGQIVEFSTDQHGSRFIQQKLESCGSDEKESVFKEILPQVSKLMIDVFGNYVVQKFFEHGTVEQRRKLGQQLSGQVLTLSLQMYGCRVIQKALEVIEPDQKVELMKELDGHVMKCVHDQNGNHVIQKCIESVPIEKIKFIISSFVGQVATLSCHPYGCRVIQRVLEHCSDEQISQWIVEEVLKSTSTLAHDPYGNYVTQHVMEMGKPHQRSQIIQKLSGRFVQLSQHKFASNVVEKCIKYGNDSERDIIIEEIIAQSDNNEALLMMMKDQFANYVVQKIFEIGSEKQKEILKNCIRLHLPVLKKVPYAKHIVSRYDQLTGIGILLVPYALASGGWLSLLLLIIVAMTAFYTSLLIKRCMEVDSSIRTYPGIGERAFGKIGRLITSVFMCTEIYLVVTGFLIMEGDNLHNLFPQMKFESCGIEVGGRESFVLIIAVFILPSIYMDDLSILSYISATGVIASIVIVMSIFSVGTLDRVGFHNRGELLNWSGIPTTVSLYGFCYCAHPVFPSLYNSMQKKHQFSKVLFLCFLCSTIGYASMAVIGYLMYGSKVDSQITLNLPIEALSSKIAIYTTLVNPISKYALMLEPVVSYTESWFPNHHKKRYKRFMLRTGLVASQVIVALIVPFFGFLMSLVGAFLSITASITLPCLFYLKISGKSIREGEGVLVLGTVTFGILIAILGTYTSLVLIIQENVVGY